MSNHLIFYTSTDQKGRHDATGAFIPEAMKLARHIRSNGDTVMQISIETRRVSLADRRAQVERVLKEKDNLKAEHIHFLCHGYKTGIQFGYKWQWGADRLVKSALANSPNLKSITFYCCSVSKGTENFAKMVFDACKKYAPDNKIQVFGHYSAGHTTMNPNIKIYTHDKIYAWSGNNALGYEQLIVGDKNKANDRMHDIDDPFRFEVPFFKMNQDEKENMCKMVPICCADDDCVYRNSETNRWCKYRECKTPDLFECISSVARVNAMTLEIKRLTEGL